MGIRFSPYFITNCNLLNNSCERYALKLVERKQHQKHESNVDRFWTTSSCEHWAFFQSDLDPFAQEQHPTWIRRRLIQLVFQRNERLISPEAIEYTIVLQRMTASFGYFIVLTEIYHYISTTIKNDCLLFCCTKLIPIVSAIAHNAVCVIHFHIPSVPRFFHGVCWDVVSSERVLHEPLEVLERPERELESHTWDRSIK